MSSASAPVGTEGLGTVGALLLAGGRGSRMGGVTKPLLEVGGRTLLRRAVTAVAGCRPVTIVAELLDPELEGVDWVREDPPHGGPAAGVVAALASWRERGEHPERVLLLACDLPHPDAAVAALTSASLPRDAAGACLVDATGRAQWLAGVYRLDALREAAHALPDAGRGAPMRALLGHLAIVEVPAPPRAVADIDTWQDLEEALRGAAEEES